LRNPKAIVAFAHDATIAAASMGLALYLRLGDTVLTLDPFSTFTTIVAFAAIASVTFRLFGMYRGVWRYASTFDLLNIAKAATVAVLIFLALTFILNRLDFVPRSVPFIQWCLLIVGLGGSRFAYRLLRDQGLLSRPAARPQSRCCSWAPATPRSSSFAPVAPIRTCPTA
jgi:O-antigen biosynthesis protein WbqV